MERAEVGERPRELGDKERAVRVAVPAPFSGDAAYGAIVHHFHVTTAASQVHDDVRAVAFREGEAHQAGPLRGGQLDAGVEGGQVHGVVTWRGLLAGLVVVRGGVVGRHGPVAHHGHHHGRTACAVGRAAAGEADHRRAAVVVGHGHAGGKTEVDVDIDRSGFGRALRKAGAGRRHAGVERLAGWRRVADQLLAIERGGTHERIGQIECRGCGARRRGRRGDIEREGREHHGKEGACRGGDHVRFR